MQDKSINNALLELHKRAMNGSHDGLEHIEAIMHLRGVEPADKRRSPIGGGTTQANTITGAGCASAGHYLQSRDCLAAVGNTDRSDL